MIFERASRKLAATVAVAVMLFAQIAIAAHACAAIAGGAPAHETTAMSHGGSPCEQPAAPAQDKLCLDHCAGQQSVDPHPVSPAPAALAPICSVAPADAVAFYSTQRYPDALLARVTAPPLPVRHCCFRT